MKVYRWGIVGTGGMSAKFSDELALHPRAQVAAVCSRDVGKAQAFGERYGAAQAYGDLDALLSSDVDLIYVGTLHPFHKDAVLRAMAAGKPVVCEKPMTMNAGDTAQCLKAAKDNSCFLMEAVWMRFFPALNKLKAMIDAGELGDIVSARADLCFHRPYGQGEHRLDDPAKGGGAILDLGIYPLSFAQFLFGNPERASVLGRLNPRGADELASMTLQYADGMTAQLMCSQRIESPSDAVVWGSKGYARLAGKFHASPRLEVQLNGEPLQVYEYPAALHGYNWEIEEVTDCLDQGRLESERMPHADTLAMARLMDQLIAQLAEQA